MNFNEPSPYSFVKDLHGDTFVFITEKYNQNTNYQNRSPSYPSHFVSTLLEN